MIVDKDCPKSGKFLQIFFEQLKAKYNEIIFLFLMYIIKMI